MKLEVGKRYITRGGQEVRIYAVDGGTQYPVHGAVIAVNWCLRSWEINGQYSSGGVTEYDIVGEWPEEMTMWINIGPNGVIGSRYQSKAEADSWASSNRIACKRITFKKGDVE